MRFTWILSSLAHLVRASRGAGSIDRPASVARELRDRAVDLDPVSLPAPRRSVAGAQLVAEREQDEDATVAAERRRVGCCHHAASLPPPRARRIGSRP
jgi:hypothetical protein